MQPLYRPLFAAAVLTLSALPLAAHADIGGTWHVTGEISGRRFATDCRLEPRGSQLGGECVTLSTGEEKVKAGKIYRLTRGSISGNQVSWSYPTKVLFMSVDIVYAGTLNGDRINGTISAAGRKGAFSGVRK